MTKDFDRTSRYVLVSRALRAMVEPPGPIVDVGGSGGLLRELLPAYKVIQIDVAGSDCDVIGSGTALPFGTDAAAAVAALDVLEHIPESWRSPLVSEMVRVSRGPLIIAGPFASELVDTAESLVDQIYRELTGRPHRWLSEHRDYGLPNIESLYDLLDDAGLQHAEISSNPIDLWTRLQFADFVGAESGHPESLGAVHQQLLDHYLDGHDGDGPGYRQIVFAAPDVATVRTAVQASRPNPGRVSAWTTEEAIRQLDRGVARSLRDAFLHTERLRREKDQKAARMEELGIELRKASEALRRVTAERDRLGHDVDELARARNELDARSKALRSSNDRLAQQLVEAQRRLAQLEEDYRKAVAVADATRQQLDTKWREKVQLEKVVQQTRRELKASAGELARARATLRSIESDANAIAASKRWRIGGILTAPVRVMRGKSNDENAVARIIRTAGTSLAHEPRPAPGEVAALERMADEVERDILALVSSRRWRAGRLMTAPTRLFRSEREPADVRLLERIRRRPSTGGVAPEASTEAGRALQQWIAAQVQDAERIVTSRAWKVGSFVAAISLRRGEPAIERLRRVGARAAAWSPPVTEPTLASTEAADTGSPPPSETESSPYERYIEDVEPSVIDDLPGDGSGMGVIVRPSGPRLRDELDAGDSVEWFRLRGFEATTVPWPGPMADIVAASKELGTHYVAVVEPGDDIEPWVLRTRKPGETPDIIVTDHDVLVDGRRENPQFLGGIPQDLILERDVLRRAALFNTVALSRWHEIDHENFHRDVLLQTLDNGGSVVKADVVAFHFPPDDETPANRVARDRAFADRTVKRRRAVRAQVERLHHQVRVRYRPAEGTTASIIVPFKDKPDLLATSVRSILRLTGYDAFEIILVDNLSKEPETHALLEELTEDPRVRVIQFLEAFNYSRANNLAAETATGDVLVFLNNDTQVLSPDWLERLLGQAQRPDVGAVGARLYFADGSLQHAGVVVGMTGFAAHLFSGTHAVDLPPEWVGQTRDVSAVTAACLAVERRKFDQVGGFDESFQLTGNDVDFCLRLLRAGYRNIFDPAVELFHFEKQTRAPIKVPKGDQLLSLERYEPFLSEGDPYYNRNLTLTTTALEPRTGPNPGRKHLEQKVFGDGDRLPRPGLAYLELYDASDAELTANRDLMEAFYDQPQGPVSTVSWFVPHFDHAYRGGIYTILRVAQTLTDREGTLNRFVLCGRNSGDLDGIERKVREAFPNLKAEFVLHRQKADAAALPPSDLAVCTLWTTAYEMLTYNQCRGKFYFVQDYEPVFQPANEIYGLIEQTYRFGYIGICNTQGVREAYEAYGSPAIHFVPGVDAAYRPSEVPPAAEPLQIVFYGRPTNPRNGFELGLQALRRVKQRYGDRVRIISAGAEWDPRAYDVDGIIDNAGILPDIVSVAQLYRESAIGLVFMFSKHPSYQPLEYMASGCATVTNFNEANLWLLKHEVNSLLVAPTVSATADAIARLVEDERLRGDIRTGGLETVAPLEWGPQLNEIYEAMAGGAWR